MPDLSIKDQLFVDEYMKDGNGMRAAIRAGFVERSKSNNPEDVAHNAAYRTLQKPSVKQEILTRTQEMRSEAIADATEILEFYTRIIRGEELDQFGLEIPAKDKISAAKELQKLIIEMPMKLQAQTDSSLAITIRRE